MAAFEIQSDYDAQSDIRVVYPCGRVMTEDDCKAWLAAHEEVAARHTGYAHWIAVLDMFSIGPEIYGTWCKYFAQHIAQFRGICLFVGSESATIGAAGLSPIPRELEAKDIPSAIATIKTIRAAKRIAQLHRLAR